MDYPSFKQMKFSSCCKRSIQTIHDILKAKELLHLLLPASVFATILVSPYKGFDNFVSTSWSIANTDFKLFAEAMLNLKDFGTHEIKNICAHEMLIKHPLGDLHKFWQTMYNIF